MKSTSGDPLEQQLKIPFAPDLHRDQDVNNLVAAHQPFWYVTSSNGLAKDIGTILYGVPGWEVSGGPRTFSEPFSPISVTVTKYVYTGHGTASASGTLHLHVTGLRPPGNLLIALFDSADSYPIQPSNVAFTGFSNTKIIYTFDELSFGDYVIFVFHDENNNKSPEQDSETSMFTEGHAWANMDKVDLRSAAAVREGSGFNNIKYSFDEDGETVEMKMYYAPFPWQNE
jgi:uncharacterized protein (DUF2141 family)